MYGERVELPTHYDEERMIWIHDATSKREYVAYTVHGATKSEDKWVHPRPVEIHLYVDTETGIVTTDVRAFEKWIGA